MGGRGSSVGAFSPNERVAKMVKNAATASLDLIERVRNLTAEGFSDGCIADRCNVPRVVVNQIMAGVTVFDTRVLPKEKRRKADA